MAVGVSGKHAPTVDWTVLGHVCGRDEGLLVRLLEAFLEDGQKDSDDLARALEVGDLAEVSRVAHRIYGAAKTVGATDLAQVSRLLDDAGLAGQAARVAELGPQVRDQFAALTEVIRARSQPPP
jgi:HPt (histidine-containing phosphotransfer) domain-containing protein